MRVLVTGASGHIGGATARLLQERGHVVRAAVRNPAAAPEGCETVPLNLAGMTPEAVMQAIGDCDTVVHAAAWMNDDHQPENALDVNITATLRLLEAARQHVRVFVLISGLNFLRRPLSGLIPESWPADVPSDLYALGKLAAESLSLWFAREAATCRVVVLRPSSPVGPGLRRRRIFSLFCDAAMLGAPIYFHGSGARVQDYVDARDIARAVLAALEHPHAAGIFHIGSGKAVSNLELASRCVTVLASTSKILPSGRPDPEEGPEWMLDISRAARELEWMPVISIEDSIRDYAAWRKSSKADIGKDDR